ncbi:alpha/beta hydrolase [Patescibacteria group bacterium]
METIILTTKDGINIAGDYYAGSSFRGILLLHMMPETRGSWKTFAEELAIEGYKVLSIDLRGHGDSTTGSMGKLDYQQFSNEEHASSIHDVEASIEFLEKKGAHAIFIVGASIGANLALWYAVDNPENVKGIALLSPGLDYKGIRSEANAIKLSSKIRVMLYSGGDQEDEYSKNTVQRLKKILKVDDARLRIFEDAGHGTRIFDSHPEFMKELMVWMQ